MSLIIAVSDGANLCVAGDTLDARSEGAPMPEPVEKVRILEGSEADVVTAIAGGDIVINDLHLFDHLVPWTDRLQTAEGFENFTSYFQEQWMRQFEADDFSSQDEKENYFNNVRTTVFVARSPSDVSLFAGTCGQLKIQHFHQFNRSLVFGTPTEEVKSMISQPFPAFGSWLSHLGTICTEGERHRHVSAPFDVVLWSSGQRPFRQRYSLESLRATHEKLG